MEEDFLEPDRDAEPDTRTGIPDTAAVAFYRKCEAYARGRGCQNHTATEFAAWAVCKIMDGRPPVPRWLFPDFFRESLGRTGAPTNQVRQALAAPLSLDAPLDGVDGPGLFEIIEGRSGSDLEWHAILQSKAGQRALQVKDAALVIGHYVYGVTCKELATVLKFSEATIYQRVKKARKKMEAALEGKTVQLIDDGHTAQAVADMLNAQGETGDRGEKFTEFLVEEVVKEKRKRDTTPVDTSNFKLEMGVPIPTGYSKEESPLRIFMKKMEVGHSFEAEHPVGKKAVGIAKSLKFKIAVRRLSAEKCRIWRTA